MDNVDVGYQAARHLLDLGRRRLVWITDGHSQPLNDREVGIRRALLEYAGARVERILVDDIYEAGGRQAAAAVASLAPLNRPDAVFAGTGSHGRGFIDELQAISELRVPDDLLLIATDGNRLANVGALRLSRIVEPAFDMGYRAVELLAGEVGDDAATHIHQQVFLSGRFELAETSLGRT